MPVKNENEISFCIFKSTIGSFGISWCKKRIIYLQLPQSNEQETRGRLIQRCHNVCETLPPAWVRKIINRIQKHLEGSLQNFSDVPLDLRNTPVFYQRVYKAARTIVVGQTKTYGQIAKLIKSPNAARAVGQALGHNPIGLIVPCHRVIAAGQKLGGFSAFGGLTTKTKLLQIEGIHAL